MPDAGHQPLLVEDEGIDVLRDRRAGDRLADALIDDDDARPDADLEAVARVEIGERTVVHEEERVAEDLHAGLQAVGRRDGVVVANRLAALQQHAFADLPAEHEAGLDDVREDQHGRGLLAEQARRGVLRVETLQRLGRRRGSSSCRLAATASGACISATVAASSSTLPNTLIRVIGFILLSPDGGRDAPGKRRTAKQPRRTRAATGMNEGGTSPGRTISRPAMAAATASPRACHSGSR